MNIYFTASIVGKKHYLQNYLKIIEILKKENHKIIYEHIIDSKMEEVDLQTEEKRKVFHQKLKNWIMEADCVVVETSFPSISVGFEISLALNLGKRVLILYTKDAPTLLSSYENERLICSKYRYEDLKETLDEFINYVRGKSEHRFTFFINSRIAHFLEQISRKKRIPKSVYIRSLIEKEMKA